jgi:hypothetical protein
MSLHLFSVAAESNASDTGTNEDELRLLCAYEDGGVTLWRYSTPEKQVSIEGIGWENIWTAKLHADSSGYLSCADLNLLVVLIGSHGNDCLEGQLACPHSLSRSSHRPI